MLFLYWCKRYSICQISFFNLYELFPAFICADNIGSMANSLFGVSIFLYFLSLTSSSSPSSAMSDKSVDSSLSVFLVVSIGSFFSVNSSFWKQTS